MPGTQGSAAEARQQGFEGLAMKKLFVIFLLAGSTVASAATTNNQGNVNSQELKEDYRLFLQQLKQLNSQYKEVTGQMAQVMKEEGVPTWDAGDADKKVAELFPKEDTILVPEAGVTIQESPQTLIVTVDLPGIKKDTLKIAVQDGNRLILTAERKAVTGPKKVQKTIQLPALVDPKGAQAGYEDGVLTLKLTKNSTQEVVIPVR